MTALPESRAEEFVAFSDTPPQLDERQPRVSLAVF